MASDERAARVLELVRGLTTEVHPHASRLTVTLDSPFDDLGIGSLELAELLMRVQDSFGVALPAHVLSSAETPRDLVRAVAQNGAPVVEDIGIVAPPVVTAGGSAPVAASTLIDALDWHVGATPERTHIRILDESGSPEDVTYQALHQEAAAVAAGLLARDVMPGDTVAIMLPTSREYFVTFAGVVLAGAVPVPIYPPARPSQLADHLRRHTGILANARAALLVTVPEAVRLGHLLRSNVDSLRHVVVPESLTGATGGALPRPRSADLALVQYTSGSTGQPKGVALTHDNLLANIRAMGQAVAVSGADTFVSWLPLYHDMGLIGAWLSMPVFRRPAGGDGPAAVPDPPVAMAEGDPRQPGHDLGRPELRLRALPHQDQRRRARRTRPELLAVGLQRRRAGQPRDDRAVRRALRPLWVSAGRDRRRCTGWPSPPSGWPSRRWAGARSSTASTATHSCVRGGPNRPSRVSGTPFVSSPAANPCPATRSASSTPPATSWATAVRAASSSAVRRRPPAISTTPTATRSLFHEDWLDTGDLGYMADADLYVTGRVKDMIIRAGRNLHPAELEEAVGNLAGVRKGCVAVFASPDPAGGAERLVVMAETRATGRRDDRRVALRDRLDDGGSARRGTRRRGPGATADGPEDLERQDPSGRQPGDLREGQDRRPTTGAVVGIGSHPAPRSGPSLRRARHAAAAVAFAAYAWMLFAVLALAVIAVLAAATSDAVALADGHAGRSGSWPA